MRPPGTERERHPSLDSKIIAALDRIGEVLQVLARRAAEDHDMSPIQLRVLNRLYAGPPPAARTSALAREFEVSDPTISDAIAALRRKGLVERHRDDNDRRVYHLQLTNAGRSVAHAVSRWTAPAEMATARIERPDGEQLLITLLDVLAQMCTAGLVDSARACTTCRHLQTTHEPGHQPRYRCELFQFPMEPTDLRVDCPVHEFAAIT